TALHAALQRLVDADLAHPAVATPVATGFAGASVFLAQDFAAAEPIDATVRTREPMPPADVARVAAHVAGALDFAAAIGIHHGALHPRDVLVTADDVRVTGLGVAEAVASVGVAPPVHRPYAAPERRAGQSWDRRADVYSLAAILAALLTGQRPGDEAADTAAPLVNALTGYSDVVRAVFAKAWALSPDDRYETALGFAEGLTAALETQTSAEMTPADEVPLPTLTALAAPLTPVEVHLPLDPPMRVPSDALLPGDAPLVAVDGASAGPTWDVALAASDNPRLDPAADLPLAAPAPSQLVLPADGAEPAPAAAAGGPPRAPRLSTPQANAASRPAMAASAVWPIPLALMVGLIVGIAVGFFVFGQARSSDGEQAQSIVAAPASSVPGPSAATPADRDAVSVVVPGTPPAGSPPPASPEPAAPAAPAVESRAPAVPEAAVATSPSPLTGAGTAAGPPAPALGESVRSAPGVPADGGAERSESSGRLLVRSSPAGAWVTLNGKDVGVTPLTLRVLPFGTHVVQVRRDGYGNEERRVTLSAARPAQSLTVDLERPAGGLATVNDVLVPLSVESRPAGAWVFLDGRRIGTTPLRMSVATGGHVVRLELDGYRRWSSSVRVTAGERNRVTASLEQ
ncbi:MAG: PEGA domain-containing protein, partial [Vicinamibacterales bacterium]